MDFFLTTDIAPTNILAASSDVTEDRHNVANAEETGLLGLAKALLRAMDCDLAAEHGPDCAANEAVRWLADIQSAPSELGFEAGVGLENGLRDLIEGGCPQRDEMATGRTPASA